MAVSVMANLRRPRIHGSLFTPLLLALASGAPGCAGDPAGALLPTPDGDGPLVVFDLEATPLPEIPFPNDLATVADPASPSGRRLNISQHGSRTAHERRTRARLDTLEGFSTFGEISVSFEAALDLGNIDERQRKNRSLEDDVILVVNVDPRSKGYGQAVPLDLGQGSYPEPLPRLTLFWARDPRAEEESLLYDTTDEDENGNGVLDAGEDTDGDGYLDVPNVYPKGGDRLDDLVSYYEMVTRTLVVRPLVPLEQETRYAVVLTRNLVGNSGEPVKSPWAGVNHTRQTAALEPLREILPTLGLAVEDVAFAWSFTTQGTTRDLEALRAGLYGHGLYARLAKEFPPDLEVKAVASKGQNLYVVPAKIITSILESFGSLIKTGVLDITEEGEQDLLDSFRNVDYFVFGEATGPDLLVDRDHQPTTDTLGEANETWEMNRREGTATYGSHAIPFMCTIPRADRGNGPPFPVAIYAHGHSSTRLEQLAFSGNIARYGIATCTVEAVDHGLNIGDYNGLVRLGLTAYGIGPLFDQVYPGRMRDVNNDGKYEAGEDFFSADLFATRDNLRQTVLDYLAFIRALRALDGKRSSGQDYDGDGHEELAGDFNADGVVDLGGPDVAYYAWGTSMGGITSAILAGIEPVLVAASPQAVGGGLIDVSRRSVESAVVYSVLHRLMSPIFIGSPQSGGGTAVTVLATSGGGQKQFTLTKGLKVEAGDRIVLENLTSGASRTTTASSDGGFRLAVPADALTAAEKRIRFGFDPLAADFAPVTASDTTTAGDALRLSIYDKSGTTRRAVLDRFGDSVTFEGVVYPAGAPLVALSWGYGLPRDSPDLRRMISMGQMVVDPGDPINYAPHYRKDPLSFPYDQAEPGTNTLIIGCAGDTTVPVATAVSLARAAGAVDFENVDSRFGKTPNQVLIDSHITEGLARLKRYGGVEILADPEDFSRGKHAPAAPRLSHPLRLQKADADGMVALRIPLLNPKGQHAFLLPTPTADFDMNTFLIHMVARFLKSGGKDLVDDACMATASCSWIPKLAAPPE
jgi:hypothetical protein